MSNGPTSAAAEDLRARIAALEDELRTLRKQAAQSLASAEESDKRFAILFESSPVAIALARLSDNVLVDFNAAMMELTGYQRKEIAGKSAIDLNLYASPEARTQLLDELERNGKVANLELRIRRKSGEILDLLYSGALISLGDRSHLLSMAVDITERNRLDAALKASEEKLRRHKDNLETEVQERTKELREQEALLEHILANIPAAVFWKDRASVFLGCNAQFACDAGLGKAEEIVGKTDYDLTWTKQQSDYFRTCDRQVMESGRPMFAIEESQLQADGTEATLLTNKVPLKDAGGRIVGLLGAYMDITERKQVEEERSKLLSENQELYRQLLAVQEQERKHLARELHDDLGQNLIAILLHIDLLCDPRQVTRDDWLARSGKIRQLTARMVESLQGIVKRLWPESLDSLGLVASITETIDLWRLRHENVGIDLDVTGSLDGLEQDINITIYRLVQECLTNIEKHAEASDVSIRLARTAHRLRLTVRDNGRGMNVKEIKTGIGIPSMRERIVRLNGSFEVQSSPGKGVAIFVTIPLTG
jgi:PAS domain S-box-containing protein